MRTDSWQGILAILFLLIVLVTPIVAIYTENSEHRVKRTKFALWSLVFLLFVFFIMEPILEAFRRIPGTILSPSLLIIIAGGTIFQAMFLRVLVRRLRDAGHDESLAYLFLIPLMNLGLVIYLTFKASAPFRPGSGLNITEDAIS